MSNVLIVDDEEKILNLLSDRISREGHRVSSASSAEQALELIKRDPPDIVLCDLRLPGMDGLGLLRLVKRESPGTDFIIMTAYASAKTAVKAMTEGAYEYIIKPFQMDEVLLLLRRIEERQNLLSVNAALIRKTAAGRDTEAIVGESREIAEVREKISKVAPTLAPALIRGESGTGKELAAELIHKRSNRSEKAYIVMNCAAVPETLLESELFGHEKGAFTGASDRKPGLFKLADQGTLFLDEIGDMPLPLQAKVLRAVENGEFMPLGSSENVKVDVRIIAATNRDLEKLSEEGKFRKDLFFRLNVFPIYIPPLRERKIDLEPLSLHFLEKLGRPVDKLPDDVMKILEDHEWPGNVRELKNILERALILAGPEDILLPQHVQLYGSYRKTSPESTLDGLLGEKTLPEIEKTLIIKALEHTGGNKSRAAEVLGITRRTLYGRLEKFGIEKDGKS